MARPIAYSGRVLTVAFAVCLNGESPGEEFFDRLDEGDQVKMLKLFQRMGDTGRISNREKFKKLQGRIWEFKSGQVRMPCYQTPDRALVVTHGFFKKKDDISLQHLDRANRIMQEDYALHHGGTYQWFN